MVVPLGCPANGNFARRTLLVPKPIRKIHVRNTYANTRSNCQFFADQKIIILCYSVDIFLFSFTYISTPLVLSRTLKTCCTLHSAIYISSVHHGGYLFDNDHGRRLELRFRVIPDANCVSKGLLLEPREDLIMIHGFTMLDNQ